MITQERVDGQTVGPYGRLRFGQPRQSGLTHWEHWEHWGPADLSAWTRTEVVEAARRHVLLSKGENAVVVVLWL